MIFLLMKKKNFLTLGSLWGANLPLAFINFNQMSHILIITAYQPAFSFSLKSKIKKYISPSMISCDNENEKSYFLENIIDEIEDISVEDRIIFDELSSQNVEYVEF